MLTERCSDCEARRALDPALQSDLDILETRLRTAIAHEATERYRRETIYIEVAVILVICLVFFTLAVVRASTS
jgi:hypothetical protein